MRTLSANDVVGRRAALGVERPQQGLPPRASAPVRPGKFRAPKMAIVRFKKAKGIYRKQSSFNISSENQARQIAAVWHSISLLVAV